MKTNQPHPINYKTQYQMMRLAEALMPLMPERIIDKFSAVMTPRMEKAEEQASLMHTDRYDMVVDWGCVAQRIVRTKVNQ